jgi:hypothetical protein
MMARPEYKAKQDRLERGIEITEPLFISFWFNIKDDALKAQLDAYYKQHKDDWKQQPGIEIQVKTGDNYHRVCRSRLWIDDGGPQQAAPAPIAPPPVVSMEPSFDPSPAPPPPEGYGNG